MKAFGLGEATSGGWDVVLAIGLVWCAREHTVRCQGQSPFLFALAWTLDFRGGEKIRGESHWQQSSQSAQMLETGRTFLGRMGRFIDR